MTRRLVCVALLALGASASASPSPMAQAVDHGQMGQTWPVIEPDRDVRGFQSVLIDLANRLKLPNFTDAEDQAK
ncbi:MAG: hypothetical protein AAFY81_05530, partial [Pseudomonadota bacterium]